MPYAPRPICRYPGCNERAVEGSGYCSEHKKEMDRQYNRYERTADPRKYGRSWKKIRAWYIMEHPLCECCLKEGKAVMAEEVHHILPTSRGGTHDKTNLMALCRSCHNRIHHELGDR